MRTPRRLATAVAAFAIAAGSVAALATPASAKPPRPDPIVVVGDIVSLNKGAIAIDLHQTVQWGTYIIKDLPGGAFFTVWSAVAPVKVVLLGVAAPANVVINEVRATGHGLVTLVISVLPPL